jgi:uncharacterized membrane protein (DUF373 family)
MARSTDPDIRPRWHRVGTLLLEIAETIVYVGIAGLLSGTAAVLLVIATGRLVAMVRDPGPDAGIEVLDTLLLLFIIVELLFAVRTTLRKRELVAEPFLLVGIIASIKEIVVLSVKAAENVGRGAAFRDQLAEIAVLGLLTLALGVTAWLLRIKEREPEEGAPN